MKRIISLLLAIALIFTFASCNHKENGSFEQKFIKPQNYSTVLLVTINPEFKLYLDEQDSVLAVEPVNEDAKTVIKDTDFVGELTNVIEKIVTKTNDAGFVKENATVELEILETKQESANIEKALNAVKDTAKQVFEKLDVTVEIKTSISKDITSSSSLQATQATSSTISTVVSSNKSYTSSNESKPVHIHSFANATCTLPKTCSCGTTDGNPLGHSFKDGKCSACGTKDPNYTTLTPLNQKNGNWTVKYILNETYYSARITLVGELSIGVGRGDPLSKMEQEIQDDIRNNKDAEGYKDSYIVYQGKEYWSAMGSYSPLAPILENGNNITLTSSEESNAQIILTRTNENTLTVKSCTQTFKDMVDDIPAGTKFTFNAE